MLLPPPTLSFTIPSIENDLVLQCRIYHPASFTPKTVAHVSHWRRRGAIVAHPYAPLGGSYDDPVVEAIAATILKQGFVVGTFNFRGAGTSKGRTSWQSKPEQNDFLSFIGFMIYYLHHLVPPALPIGFPKPTASNPELPNLSPVPSQALPPPHVSDALRALPNGRSASSTLPDISMREEKEKSPVTLLIAGYSYGALVATCLPPMISSIIAPFQTPRLGSAHAEIRLRAECLAEQQNDAISTHVNWLVQHSHVLKRGRSLQIDDPIGIGNKKVRKTSATVRMGGEEDLRRASHDSHRPRPSFSIEPPEKIRKSIDRVRSIARAQHRIPSNTKERHGSVSSYKNANHSSNSSIEHAAAEMPETKPIKEIPGIVDGLQTAYLLVSVPVGWVSSLITFAKPLGWISKDFESDVKLTIDPTLVLFGDDDAFISVRRYRAWAEKLESASGKFRYREVSGAGHFWHDPDAYEVLKEEVAGFVGGL